MKTFWNVETVKSFKIIKFLHPLYSTPKSDIYAIISPHIEHIFEYTSSILICHIFHQANIYLIYIISAHISVNNLKMVQPATTKAQASANKNLHDGYFMHFLQKKTFMFALQDAWEEKIKISGAPAIEREKCSPLPHIQI